MERKVVAVFVFVQTMWGVPYGKLPGEIPVRDWLLILTPIAIALYFLLHPDQFTILTQWLENLGR